MPLFQILGGALLISTFKSFLGGTTTFVLLNKFPLIEGGGGGGSGGGLGPPSKKSSIEGKLGGSPPGSTLLLLPLKLLLLPQKLLPPCLSLSNLFYISNSFPG